MSTEFADAFTNTLDLALLQRVGIEQAKVEFYFFFFGGSGALGLGFAQVHSKLQVEKDTTSS